MVSKRTDKETNEALKKEYDQIAPKAKKFMDAICEQITSILNAQKINLGVPMEYRVKSFDSISEKLERKGIILWEITDLEDLVGVRLILLFKRDIKKINSIINETFNVVHYEDTSIRLNETQFGYQSEHYILKMPQNWLKIPTLKDFGKFMVEIQVRTLAQHIWAATSHVLQYKQESSIPSPIKRTINRVSALLETVDLEFERVLDEREKYLSQADTLVDNAKLNVDLVQKILDEMLPEQNKISSEPYSMLVSELQLFNIDTVGALRKIIGEHLEEVVQEDKQIVEVGIKQKGISEETFKRFKKGVFFSHAGLLRTILEKKSEKK